ncbi:hypothetical protein D3C76_1101710 [compost metagenome]
MRRYRQRAGNSIGCGAIRQSGLHLYHIAAGCKPYRIGSPIGGVLAYQLIVQLLVLGICRACRLHINIVSLRVTDRRPLHVGRFIPAAAAGNGHTGCMSDGIDQSPG